MFVAFVCLFICLLHVFVCVSVSSLFVCFFVEFVCLFVCMFVAFVCLFVYSLNHFPFSASWHVEIFVVQVVCGDSTQGEHCHSKPPSSTSSKMAQAEETPLNKRGFLSGIHFVFFMSHLLSLSSVSLSLSSSLWSRPSKCLGAESSKSSKSKCLEAE